MFWMLSKAHQMPCHLPKVTDWQRHADMQVRAMLELRRAGVAAHGLKGLVAFWAMASLLAVVVQRSRRSDF